MLKGQRVRFEFNISRIMGGAKRTGFGVILFSSVVGNRDARCIEVVESPDYKVGETIDVYTSNLQTI